MRKVGIQQGFITPGPGDGPPPSPPPPNPKDMAQAENCQSQAMLNKAKTAQIMATFRDPMTAKYQRRAKKAKKCKAAKDT